MSRSVLCAALLGVMMGVGSGAAQADTIVARVSGLVCDLCVGSITSQLSKLPHASGTAVSLKNGIVAVHVTASGAKDNDVRKIMMEAGYQVHAVTHTQMSVAVISSNPAKAAQSLWAGGATEQRQVIASAPPGQACGQKKPVIFGATDPAWGSSQQSQH